MPRTNGQSELPRIGAYTLTRELAMGVGGMSAVYEAIAPDRKTTVALKVGHERFYDQLLAEANTLLRLQHRNIVRILPIAGLPGRPSYAALAEVDGSSRAYIALEFLGGGSLRDLLVAQKRLEPGVAAWIGREVALGLAHAHELGIAHNDIKPSNILFSNDRRRVVILDFGIAQHAGLDESSERRVLGSLGYAAPERLRHQPSDKRADVYSLGICLFEMLTGSHPFEASDHAGLRSKILNETAPLPSSIDPRLRPFDAIIAGCLEGDPSKRLLTASQVADALGAFVPAQRRPVWPFLAAALAGSVALGVTLLAAAGGEAQQSVPVIVTQEASPVVTQTASATTIARAPTSTPVAEATEIPAPTSVARPPAAPATPRPAAPAGSTAVPPVPTPTFGVPDVVPSTIAGVLFPPTFTPIPEAVR